MSERWPNDSDKLGTAEWRCEECGTINSCDFETCDECGYSQDGVPPPAAPRLRTTRVAQRRLDAREAGGHFLTFQNGRLLVF